MKKFKIKSLAMRIGMTFTITILIFVSCISFLYFLAFRKIDEGNKTKDLKASHDQLLQRNSYNQPNRFDEFNNLKWSKHFILEFDNSGNKLFFDVDPNGGLHPPQPSDKDGRTKEWMGRFAKSDSMDEEQFKESYGNSEFIFVISSINIDRASKAYLISYMPNEQDYVLLYIILIIGAMFIVMGFFTAKIIAKYMSKPLMELEGYTKKIANKDWEEPIVVKSDDEIGRLADSMNTMRKELKRADEEEKMFLQSISHDLKTPVMVIMSHADAIIDGIYVESVEKTAEIIKDEAISLEKKIKQILYLNTLNYVMESSKEITKFNLEDLLLHIVNRFEVVNSKIDWDLDIDDMVISGNAEQIQVSIENILENGLRYVENKIAITLKEENDFAILDIYNDGPNINNEHIDHIFNNLYKDKTGNFGLGLAISKKIIDFYNGDIKAVNREKGVSFIIKLPLVQ